MPHLLKLSIGAAAAALLLGGLLLAFRHPPRTAPPPSPRQVSGALVGAEARVLDLDARVLGGELAQGHKLYRLAADHGMSKAAFHAALLAAVRTEKVPAAVRAAVLARLAHGRIPNWGAPPPSPRPAMS
jgi:hypothetical protein